LVFYTDGVTEAMDADEQLFEVERLRAVVAAHKDDSAEEMMQAIIRAVNDFTGNIPQADDFTLFVIKREEK
jgi:sigma-B regulation protein RsbU (phosphoserine phosphatase)